MDKPHWKCPKCDGGRYKIWKDKGISCYKCGMFFPIIDEITMLEKIN